MDVKITFLNKDHYEEVYMQGFIESGNEYLVCKFKKSIYSLKQASRQQWYLKCDEVINSMGFVENNVDLCIYLKVCGTTHYSSSLCG